MLQLSGALPNVEDALRKLYEFFRRMHASKQGVFRLIDCENELKMLEDWGVEWGVEKEASWGSWQRKRNSNTNPDRAGARIRRSRRGARRGLG